MGGGPYKGGVDRWADDAVLMELVGITDWRVFNAQPAKSIEARILMLERRGKYQAEQADRANRKGPAARKVTRPPEGIERSD